MSSDYELEDTVYLPFTTRAFATGIPTALVSGVVDIYEDATATPIITGETLAVTLNSVAGFNMITVTATAATGFGAGQSYTAILQAGTVGTVSVVGEVAAHFTLGMSSAAKDLANATDGLGALKAETALILADTGELQVDDIPGKIAALDAVVDTVKDETALIVGDTDELQTNQGNWLTATGFATPINITAATGITLAASTGLGTQSGTVGGIAGTITTLDALDTAQDTKHDATVSTGNSAWATVTGHATPTNITAGTMTTVTNLTNAATAGDLTAVMKTSVNTEADTAITDGALATAAALAAAKVDTAAIKVKTDLLTFTVGTRIDAQMLGIKGKTITGTGTAGDEYDVT